MIAESRFVQPADGVVVVRRPSVRSAAKRESAIHHAADAHVPKLSVAFRHAFAIGRRALGTPPNAKRAADAVAAALSKTLRPSLLACMKAGGEVALGGLRTLGDVEGHPFHGNQWTSGSDVYHGSTKDFDAFDVAKVGTTSDEGWLGKGTYFSTDKRVAEYYPLAYETKVTLDNPLKIEQKDFKSDKRNVVREALGLPKSASVDDVTNELLKRGHDGVVLDMSPTGYKATEVMAIHNKSMSISRKYETGNNKMWDRWSSRPHSVKARGYLVDKSGRQLEAVGIGAGLRVAERFEEELRTLRPGPKKKIGAFNLQFDIKNARAAKWALEHVGWLIDSITATTRERIQEAVARAQIGGDLKQQYEGILAAVGDEDRANVIARTESMSAANFGQQEGWAQARDEGLLPADTMKIFIATEVGACPICEEMDGETVPMDDEFSSGDVQPPIHPSCRCTTSLTFGVA